MPFPCWQHTVPYAYIENPVSHLHAIIRTNHFDFEVRFWTISALMLKTIHQGWIQCWVLSVIYAYDHFSIETYSIKFFIHSISFREYYSPIAFLWGSEYSPKDIIAPDNFGVLLSKFSDCSVKNEAYSSNFDTKLRSDSLPTLSP